MILSLDHPSLTAEMQQNPTETVSLRYRPGTHAKGEDTLRRILEVAIEVFAEEGYDGASTRVLAERAKVNLPAIQYYFGSKEGLYRAAIDHIAKFVENRMAPLAVQAQVALAGNFTPDELLTVLLAMLDGFLDLITTNDAPPSACLFITRAEMEDATALDALQQMMMQLVSRPCMALVARMLGREQDDEAKIRTSAILGQALMFKKKGTKMGACPALGWDEIDETRLHTLKTILREQTTAIIRAAMDKAK
jgi:AcrR family transcriptional regulator